MITVLRGDAREVLRTLEAKSFHCVVTSPPYHRLRSYLPKGHPDKAKEMGSEPTVEAYVAALIETFREVRRVLREDGVCFVNLGSNYASDDNGPNRSRQSAHVLACDTGGKELRYCSGLGSACHDPHDEPQDGSPSRPLGIASNGQRRRRSALRPSRKARDIEQQDCVSASLGASPPGAPASTKSSSMLNDRIAPDLEDETSVFPPGRQTTSPVFQASVGKLAYTDDKAQNARLSTLRNLDTALLNSACGCGSCGVCWAYLAIPLLRFKPKDLMDIPALVAMALQADGWLLRSRMPWIKRSVMPESVTARPGSAVEYVFMFTKSERYYWDHVAVQRKGVVPAGTRAAKGSNVRSDLKDVNGRPPEYWEYTGTRNFRNSDLFFSMLEEPYGLITDADGTPVALDVNPEPLKDAHFAAFPSKLVHPLILGATSEMGCCSACGAPRWRVLERKAMVVRRSERTHEKGRTRSSGTMVEPAMAKTVGWKASCECGVETVPCRVLDCFGGSGTSGIVADRLGLNAVLIDLNPEYIEMARDRLRDDGGLFMEIGG